MDVVPSSLRDILLVVFVLLSVPPTVNGLAMVVYVLVLRNVAVYYRFDYKMVLVQFVKTAAFNVCVYQALVAFIPKAWFHYLYILANLIIANHLIGEKLPLQHANNHHAHVANAVGCFIFIIYTSFFLNWMNIRSLVALRAPVSPFLAVLLIATITADIFSFNGPLAGLEPPAPLPLLPHNLHINCDATRWLDIDVDAAFDDGDARGLPLRLIPFHNFDTLVLSPFRLPQNIIQPIWLVITAIKAWYIRPSIFAADGTPSVNLATKPEFDNRIVLVVLVRETEVVFCMNPPVSIAAVYVNGINWHYWLVEDNEYVVVLGLLANFQYQIDLATAETFALVVVTTTSTDGAKAPVSSESDTVATLQFLVLQTQATVHQYKAQLKKVKRDENKKLADLRHHIEVLRNKLGKVQGSAGELRTYSKIQGLKYLILELEADIERLRQEHETITQQQRATARTTDEEAAAIEREIAALEQQHQDHDDRLAQHRADLAKLRGELDHLKHKLAKLDAKAAARSDDVKLAQAEVTKAKRDASTRIQRKIKRVHDNYDVILPRVRDATEVLHQECNRVLQQTHT